MRCGQQHMVIEFHTDRMQRVTRGNEVDDLVILIEWAEDLGLNAIIVTVQALTDISIESNEVPGAKDQIIF